MDNDFIEKLLKIIEKIFTIIINSPPGATFSLMGFVLAFFTIFSLYKISNKKDDEPVWFKSITFISLIAAILFCFIGPVISFINLKPIPSIQLANQAKILSEALKNLQENKEVNWLVRLIVYDLNNGENLTLSIDKLEKLGQKEHQFVFVADYDELRGLEVSEAVRKMGLSFEKGQHVSAIIFERSRRQIYPACARGVLQAIIDVQSSGTISLDRKFPVEDFVGHNEVKKLNEDRSKASYKWVSMKDNYKIYCKAAHTFRCSNGDKYTAINLLGNIGGDWHPLGFSKSIFSGDECDKNPSDYCNVPDWSNNELIEVFGARIFLIKNLPIESISGRYMIHFEDPDQQKIPDLLINRI